MYIRSTCALISDEAKREAEISFLVQPPQPEGVNLFSEGYVAESWMKYPKFCEVFPGGAPEAEKWLISKMLLNEEEVQYITRTKQEQGKSRDLTLSVVSDNIQNLEAV
jgi:hypothetical protein